MRTPEIEESLTVAADNTAQIALTFDDNRLASALFGQYGQNLALIERRLGVVATSRGNQVTLEGPREGEGHGQADISQPDDGVSAFFQIPAPRFAQRARRDTLPHSASAP